MILGNRGPVTSSQGVGVTAASAAKETGVGVRKRAGYGAFRDVYRPGLVSVNLTVVCPVEGQYTVAGMCVNSLRARIFG